MESPGKDSCVFCKMIDGVIKPEVLYQNDKVYAFLDHSPLSRGHALVIPKFHGVTLTDIPDEYLSELLPVAKKLTQAMQLALPNEAQNYNILQNNGAIAHQVVKHVHFHIVRDHTNRNMAVMELLEARHRLVAIPKPDEEPLDKKGLVIGWPNAMAEAEAQKDIREKIVAKLPEVDLPAKI